MTITLIKDSNKKIEGSKAKEAKKNFLTSEERQAITNIIEEIRQEAIYYDKYKEDTEQTGKYDNFELAGIFFTFLDYQQQVSRIKEIFANVKQRVSKEEQEKEVNLLEQNILGILEKLTMGIDYWENIDKDLSLLGWIKVSELLRKELRESWSESQTHIETMQYASELVKLEIEKETADKTKVIVEKSEMLRASDEKLLEEKNQNEELQKLLEAEKEEKREILESFGEKLLEKDQKIEELEEQLYLVNKLLTGSKKSGKFKSLKEKIKTKSQQLVKKIKHQSQELIARIEVKTK